MVADCTHRLTVLSWLAWCDGWQPPGAQCISISQGGHKSGILGDFSEHGIVRQFCATSEKIDFALWVQHMSSNPYAAKCIWCMRTVDLSSME